MNKTELLLIDLSGIAHQAFHVSDKEPDPGFIARTIIARVRSLASAHPHAAICCDSGKSFRADIDPQYKAQRDTENRAVIKHQMDVACETLRADGFPIWAAKGFEADDIIATATIAALKMDEDISVLIASDDKDLLQLVEDRVNVHRLTSGLRMDVAGVVAKLKVQPPQVADYLALLGDKSDNIIGAKGIGEKHASDLLTAHGTLKAIYDTVPLASLKPSIAASLTEFKDRWPIVAQLIALRTDAPIDMSQIAAERTAAPMEETPMGETDYDQTAHQDAVLGREPFKQGADSNDAPLPFGTSAPRASGTLAGQPSIPNGADSGRASVDAVMAVGAVSRLPQLDAAASVPNAGGSGQLMPYVPPPAPVEFSQQLEPRSMEEAARLAGHMFKARLFNAYGTWEGVFSTILAGRELGLPAMASLRAFHIIESKPQLSADTLAALVLKSGKAKYFKCTSRSATAATFKTLRLGGDEEPFEFVYTIEEARKAWKKDEKAWNGSSWGTSPADMLVARCKSKLARLVYPDVVGGMYAVEEME